MATKLTNFDQQELERRIKSDKLILEWHAEIDGWNEGERQRLLGIEEEIRLQYVILREFEAERAKLGHIIGGKKVLIAKMQERKAYRKGNFKKIRAKIMARQAFLREKMKREALQSQIKAFNRKWHQQVKEKDKNESDKGQEDGGLQSTDPNAARDQTSHDQMHGQEGSQEGSGSVQAT